MMRISDIIEFSVKNLTRRKLRTFLTIAGIVLGTCSIVLTFAFSYTITTNIEEVMKSGADINQITILRRKYNPNKGGNKKGNKERLQNQNQDQDDVTLEYGDELVKKLSKINGVDFVFPQCETYDLMQFYVGNQYISPDFYFNTMAFDFNICTPGNLKKMGYALAPNCKFVKDTPKSKKKNIVVGSLFPYQFVDLKAKRWEDLQCDIYGILWGYGSKNDIEPFFDIRKEKLKGIVLNSKGEKQLQNLRNKLYSGMDSKNFEDDDDDISEDTAVASLENLSGSKFDIDITGLITEGDFDLFNNRNWQLLKELREKDNGWESIRKLTNIYIDIDTFKELKKIKEKSNINNFSLNDNKNRNKFAYDKITVVAKDWNAVQGIVETVQNNLNYKTKSLLGDIKEKQKQSAGIRSMLLALGVITVIVSALGIANMMFMSISERTKEIGVMKVLGCSLRNIREMFLTEAGIVGLCGGIIGVGSSYGIAKGLSAIVRLASSEKFVESAAGSKFRTELIEFVNNFTNMFDIMEGKDVIAIPIYLIIGGVLFGLLVGLISGLAPANRAVKISALAAIKQEQ
ncbi:MAG: ABC transporter permease [Oscillospiraceae bacterium]|nr:ABC transporter permease [Oscillospiraceae bacterium]